MQVLYVAWLLLLVTRSTTALEKYSSARDFCGLKGIIELSYSEYSGRADANTGDLC